MTTIHTQVSISARQRMALSVLLITALTMGSKTAHAGAEEAIAGLLVGAILVSAAQDSDARVHYRDVHTRREHYSPRPTHALKQRGHHRENAVEHKRCGYSHGHHHSKREWRKHKYWHNEQRRKAHKHSRYKRERYVHDSQGHYRGDRYGHYDD